MQDTSESHMSVEEAGLPDLDFAGLVSNPTAEQVEAFSRLSYAERLQWLDQTREFLIASTTPAQHAAWSRARHGK